MKSNKILIATKKFDLTADAIILKLREMGQLPVRLNLEDIPKETNFSLILDRSGPRGNIQTRNRRVDLQDIHSVCLRICSPHILLDELPIELQPFARAETEQALNGIWALECYWMNSSASLVNARWKAEQLKRAAGLGFEIPRTLISSQWEEVASFYELCCGKLVLKSMSGPFEVAVPGGVTALDNMLHFIPPTMLKREDIVNHSVEINSLPCVFQEYVKGVRDIRVVIVGDDIFVVELEFPQALRPPLDTCPSDPNLLFRVGALPPDVASRCYSLVKSYGLTYCIIDLILAEDGRYIFLDLNPSGQCFNLQQRLPEIRLIDAAASCLFRGKHS